MSIKPFILSTGGMTTKRIVVPIENINFDAFDKNPIMLFNHQRGLVIGKWTNRRIEDGKLLADPVFDDEDPEAKKISGKVERGFIKAASIGIRNIVAEERLDDAGESFIYVLSCDLREASVVDIPSDAEALVFYDENDKEINLKEADLTDIFQTKIFVKQMDKKKIAQSIGLSDDASDDAVLGAIETAFADSKKLKALEGELKNKQKAKAVELVDAAVSAGKLQKEVKDDFLNLADMNFDLFEKTINGLPEPVKLSQIGKTAVTTTVTSGDRKDWSFSDWQKKDPGGLAKMDDAERSEIYKAEFGD
jgi:HK97 family phage prohead protease